MDRRILNLILATMAYVNAKSEKPNQFVKGFGETKNYIVAYENLLQALEDCREFYPEVEKMVNEIMTSEASSE